MAAVAVLAVAVLWWLWWLCSRGLAVAVLCWLAMLHCAALLWPSCGVVAVRSQLGAVLCWLLSWLAM